MAKLVDSKVDSKTGMLTTNFDQILGRLLLATNTATDKEFSKSIGITRQAIGSARDRGNLPATWIVAVSEQWKVSSDWLLFGTGPMMRGATESPGSKPEVCLYIEEYHLVPLLESRVMAGPEGSILYDEVADRLPFKRFWIEKLVGRSGERQEALLLVRVRGDSMSPTIDQGEIALVDTHESERLTIQDGKIYLVMTPDGTVALKRLVVKQDDAGRPRLVCLSDNTAAYRPFSFTLDTGKSVKDHVLGRVRWSGKEFE